MEVTKEEPDEVNTISNPPRLVDIDAWNQLDHKVQIALDDIAHIKQIVSHNPTWDGRLLSKFRSNQPLYEAFVEWVLTRRSDLDKPDYTLLSIHTCTQRNQVVTFFKNQMVKYRMLGVQAYLEHLPLKILDTITVRMRHNLSVLLSELQKHRKMVLTADCDTSSSPTDDVPTSSICTQTIAEMNDVSTQTDETDDDEDEVTRELLLTIHDLTNSMIPCISDEFPTPEDDTLSQLLENDVTISSDFMEIAFPNVDIDNFLNF